MEFLPRISGDNFVHEVEELDAAAPMLVGAPHLAGGHVECGEQGRRAVPLIVVALASQRPAIGHLQIALRPLQRLDRRLFIDTDDERSRDRRSWTRGCRFPVCPSAGACTAYHGQLPPAPGSPPTPAYGFAQRRPPARGHPCHDRSTGHSRGADHSRSKRNCARHPRSTRARRVLCRTRCGSRQTIPRERSARAPREIVFSEPAFNLSLTRSRPAQRCLGVRASRSTISTSWWCAALPGSRNSSTSCSSASRFKRISSRARWRLFNCSSDGL